jgi:addiction module HigA family antidote
MATTARASDKLAPIHPGEVLFEDFLQEMGLSQYRLARDISVPPRRVNEIVHGKRSITADPALRLARYFGTSEQLWLNLQVRHDLELEPGSCTGSLPHAGTWSLGAAGQGSCRAFSCAPSLRRADTWRLTIASPQPVGS